MESWKEFIRKALVAIAMGKIHNPHRFWQTRFYPGEIMLASIANNQNEKEARDRQTFRSTETVSNLPSEAEL